MSKVRKNLGILTEKINHLKCVLMHVAKSCNLKLKPLFIILDAAITELKI